MLFPKDGLPDLATALASVMTRPNMVDSWNVIQVPVGVVAAQRIDVWRGHSARDRLFFCKRRLLRHPRLHTHHYYVYYSNVNIERKMRITGQNFSVLAKWAYFAEIY